MSQKVPQRREELKNFHGQFVDAKSPMLDQLPENTVIVVAGDGGLKETSYPASCYISHANVWMDRRDDKALAGREITIICPTCYLSMEPQEGE